KQKTADDPHHDDDPREHIQFRIPTLQELNQLDAFSKKHSRNDLPNMKSKPGWTRAVKRWKDKTVELSNYDKRAHGYRDHPYKISPDAIFTPKNRQIFEDLFIGNELHSDQYRELWPESGLEYLEKARKLKAKLRKNYDIEDDVLEK